MKKLFLFAILLIFILPFISANLGTFKGGECVNIRVLANCSQINLTEVTSPNQTFIINSPMTYLGGQTFNYSFCNTTSLGSYTYSWNNPCADCSQGDCGNDFEVNAIGTQFTVSQALIYIVGFIVMILMFFIFLYGSFNIPWKHGYDDNGKVVSINQLKYFKIVCIVFTYIMTLFIVGLSKSVTENLLNFNGINNVFNWAYWILMYSIYPILVVAFIIALFVFVDNNILKKKIKRRHFR